jgi:hypothetical protein
MIAEIAGEAHMRAFAGIAMMSLLATGAWLSLDWSFRISGLVTLRVNGLSMPNTLNESV